MLGIKHFNPKPKLHPTITLKSMSLEIQRPCDQLNYKATAISGITRKNTTYSVRKDGHIHGHAKAWFIKHPG